MSNTQTSLFEEQYEKDNSPEEQVNVDTFVLYYEESESRLFRKLSKLAIADNWEDPKDGNISDLFMKLLKEKYGERE